MSRALAEDRSRLTWWILGGLLAAVLIYIVSAYVGTFVFGVFIYYATRPVYRRLKRRVQPSSLAAGISLFVLALPALLLLIYTVAIAVQEFNRFTERYDISLLEPYISPYLGVTSFPRTPEELLAGNGLELAGDLVNTVTTYVGIVGMGALHLFIMIAIAFYLLRDDARLVRWVRRHFADGAGVFEVYASAVDRSFHQVFFGNLLNAVLTAVIGALSYHLLNLVAPVGVVIPYPTLIGLLAGVASLVPVVGMKLVYVPVAAYLAAAPLLSGRPSTLWFAALFFAVSFVIVDTIPDFVLRPYVSGRNLHVGMVMFAYIFGPLVFGWYGIFLGPMLLVLIIHFARLVLPELVAGVPIRPVAVDPSHMIDPPAAEEPSPGTDATEATGGGRGAGSGAE